MIDSRGVAAWGYGGQNGSERRLDRRRDFTESCRLGQVLADPNGARRARRPGTAKHDPLAYLQNRSVDWLDHQLALRELLEVDVANTPLIVEHEYPPARGDKADLKPILEGSIALTRYIDQAAAAMYALQNEVLTAQDIAVQGVGREAHRAD